MKGKCAVSLAFVLVSLNLLGQVESSEIVRSKQVQRRTGNQAHRYGQLSADLGGVGHVKAYPDVAGGDTSSLASSQFVGGIANLLKRAAKMSAFMPMRGRRLDRSPAPVLVWPDQWARPREMVAPLQHQQQQLSPWVVDSMTDTDWNYIIGERQPMETATIRQANELAKRMTSEQPNESDTLLEIKSRRAFQPMRGKKSTSFSENDDLAETVQLDAVD